MRKKNRIDPAVRRFHLYLKKRGVTCVSIESSIFECTCCGLRWMAMLQQGGHYGRGFWRCPKKCN